MSLENRFFYLPNPNDDFQKVKWTLLNYIWKRNAVRLDTKSLFKIMEKVGFNLLI